jgi:hypothetical protein
VTGHSEPESLKHRFGVRGRGELSDMLRVSSRVDLRQPPEMSTSASGEVDGIGTLRDIGWG